MGIICNVAASLFGGTAPLFGRALVELTGSAFMPALYIMSFSAIAVLAVLAMKESTRRPLLGSVPTVTTCEGPAILVAGQAEDPLLDTTTMPLSVMR